MIKCLYLFLILQQDKSNSTPNFFQKKLGFLYH